MTEVTFTYAVVPGFDVDVWADVYKTRGVPGETCDEYDINDCSILNAAGDEVELDGLFTRRFATLPVKYTEVLDDIFAEAIRQAERSAI